MGTNVHRYVWARLPRRTTRLRLTALCGGLFLVSGVSLLAVTYALFERATNYKAPRLPKVPSAHTITTLHFPPTGSVTKAYLGPAGLSQAKRGLAQAQNELAGSKPSLLIPSGPLGELRRQLAQVQNQLTAGQHQLAQAVHQLTQVGPAQATQRATDSHQLLITSTIALAIVIVLAVGAGWIVAGKMLRPIRTITRTAKRISSSNLHERLALVGPDDELKELGDTLDDLFERLDTSFNAQRHFVANASHELRTPLTAERTLLQVALDDPGVSVAEWRATAGELLASNDEQARLIEALLALASSEGTLYERAPMDLAALVASKVSALGPEMRRLGLQIEVLAAPAPLVGDPLLVERLVSNLLTNAVRHNVAGGQIEVITATETGRSVLRVTNTGPIILGTEVDRLFQPFQRLGEHRTHHDSGHGLGLSIVQAIANAHDAAITARPLPNGGLAIEVDFPMPAATEASKPLQPAELVR